jgi:hypothetical protein
MKIWRRSPASLPRHRKPRTRARALVAVLSAAIALAVVALWIGVHHTTWMGPLFADTARAIFGVEAVARLEEIVYGLQDDWHRWTRRNDQPEAYWEVPSASPPMDQPPPEPGKPLPPRFTLADVGPVHTAWSAPGDGAWVPVVDERHPADPPRMLKTLLHPDRGRSWTAVSVVAVDLRQMELHAVAGKYEPKSTEPEAQGYQRRGLIPDQALANLVAAFNGGFKLEHGHYGMRVDGVTLVRPRSKMCTIVHAGQDTIAIAPWERFAGTDQALADWWRQTPYCMVEDGELHPYLRDPNNTIWGCTLDGQVVIRRSAMGVSRDGKILYVGIGDDTTARAMAVAMQHAGAHDVAQLDVNYSYPKFLLYGLKGDGSPDLVAKPLCKGFEYSEDDYVRARSPRDFFYLTRKAMDGETASNGG